MASIVACRMQILPAWPPVACKFRLILFMLHATGGHTGTICIRLAATRVKFAFDWQQLVHNLHATGGHSGTIYMRLAKIRMQTLHELAASCVQSRQFFASTLREQLFE
jgi:hypothetical protein